MAKKPTPGTEVVDWEAQMAAQAEIAASAQRASGGGGKFFSMKAGVLSYDGTPMPGNRAAVIVIASTLENSYYPEAFVEGVPSSPVCFAFAEHEAALEPHNAVDNDPYFERQHDTCQGCPRNEWGSARIGKGKACSNVQRLALIPAGNFVEKSTGRTKSVEFQGVIEDEAHYAAAETAFIKLPVMSVKNFANYVKQLFGDLKRPPHGVFTEMWVEPDARSQFKVMFEVIDAIPNDLLGVIMPRHSKEQAAIDFPYNPPAEPDAQAAPASSGNKLRGKTPGKPAPKKR
jgi:hypothetical protein